MIMYQNTRFAIILLVCFSAFSTMVIGQKNRNSAAENSLRISPKLVVGIIVDQMRYDYLTRFYNQYGTGGFKRLLAEGFNCKNNHFNYAPTSTGPGHASVYTGTTPATHGIIGNNWYDKQTSEMVYCVSDNSYTSVGTALNAGQMSPNRMTVTTITDELRLHSQMRGKTIAIALKDRGAVLPGGHTANAAYWFHGKDEGNWITSSYYMPSLPKWVTDFNNSGIAKSYKKEWNTIKGIDTYLESGVDDNLYEELFTEEASPTFPHTVAELLDTSKNYDLIKATPFGNSLTVDFALEALEHEGLGKDAITDFLAISFSSTDYIGHRYGVNSKEIEDTYIRLDQDLERLFNALDKKVGNGEYILFLTADHGAIDVPGYLIEQKIPATYMNFDSTEAQFSDFLKFKFGTKDIVKNTSNFQVFLDYDVIKNLDLELQMVQEAIAREYLSYNYVDRVYTGYQMWQQNYTHGIPYTLQNGYHQKRSGDVLLV